MLVLDYSPKDFHLDLTQTFSNKNHGQGNVNDEEKDLEPSNPHGSRQIINYNSLVNSKDNLVPCPVRIQMNNPFSLDEILQCLWRQAQIDGHFNYNLSRQNIPMKVLPGKYQFIAQLNVDRALKRRKPQEIHELNQPFNPNDFHFGKAKLEEKIFALCNSEQESTDENLILINVSPLEYAHVLLVPNLSSYQPQRITLDGLKLAVESLLLSSSCNFRVGFNSLCGYASVNHLHFHAYYLNHRLFLEYAELKSLAGPCHEIIDYPAPGFAFTIDSLENEEIDNRIKEAFRLTSYFQDNNIAHNMIIIRGSSLRQKNHFDSIRIFVWARTPSYGAKESDAFNPALCELGGHFPIKFAEAYESITEEFICKELNEICTETFAKVKPFVVKLFEGPELSCS